MLFTLRLLTVFALCISSSVFAQFEGQLLIEPTGCEASGQCISRNALRFTDKAKVVWEAKADLATDGASIPKVFQPLVGQPFAPAFIKAAIVHDHYCDRHVRPWRDTHRMFYEALIDQGIEQGKAKLMYFAVYLGGPKWQQLIPGNKCTGNCINSVIKGLGKPGYKFDAADYDAKDLQESLKALASVLDQNPNALSLEDLEQRARTLRPSDAYFKSGNSVILNDAGITE